MKWQVFCTVIAIVLFAIATFILHDQPHFVWMTPLGLSFFAAAHLP